MIKPNNIAFPLEVMHCPSPLSLSQVIMRQTTHIQFLMFLAWLRDIYCHFAYHLVYNTGVDNLSASKGGFKKYETPKMHFYFRVEEKNSHIFQANIKGLRFHTLPSLPRTSLILLWDIVCMVTESRTNIEII